MKKIAIVILSFILIYLVYIGASIAFLPSVENLKNRKANITIQVKDWKGEYHSFIVGPKNRYWTPSGSMPSEIKWAVIVAEDANFYEHQGIDVKAIKNAIKYDLEKKSLARGASTITQQVAKNVFLSREKTITRKIKEVILAKRMEQDLTKGRIIELYLNVVELGPMVYGIGHGARYYFGKPPAKLTPRECAFLAAMLPGPRVAYNPYRNVSKVLKRSNMILGLLRKRGVLSEAEYSQAVAEMPNIAGLQRKVDESITREEVFPNRSAVDLPSQDAAKENESATEMPERETSSPAVEGSSVEENPEVKPTSDRDAGNNGER